MADIIKIIETCNYNYIGIRHLADDEHYQVGDYCRSSYDWDYEYDCSTYDTDEPVELSGTCAYNTGIVPGWDEPVEITKKLEKATAGSRCYYGDAVVVAGNLAQYGNDDHEIIIADAVVIATMQ